MTASKVEMKKITAVHSRDETDFYDSIMEHRDQLYNIAYSYLRNRLDALEAMQEMTCRAWIKRKTLKNPQAFKSWIIRILIYVCIDEQRRRKRAVPLAEENLLEGPVTHISHNKMEMLWALEQVKPKYRHVLLLKYYNDMTLADIAGVLNKPEGTIKTWQHKGLEQLRTIMNHREDWNHD
ncbi:sigma-70 family RNA polymerase sigma factor [Paenibacillus albidus]|uniref:sigma-70 family RNA polymerase sigma factor n=1 Tax=Paenibacillus albidus TaxID=2041023 RepID=UPI001BECC2DB|nr:sigma-70 family RNA polymerase sigma factor [Paenibacillus albidus]MBT2289644.1 sigma-70 family RNA polymerase sigma factor [Paenibacillus albidus]